MNPPTEDSELTPEKLEEEKDGGPLFHCDLYDTDIVHKIAEEFLPGLASACIDNTTGGLLKSPASVAVDIRREMVDYLIQRSENFVAESVVEGGPNTEVSENSYDIISDFVDDFSSSKRNFFSRVSGWLLSEKREDWIDDLVQEMEINGFWLLNRRESVAQTLLKNVDFKNIHHCGKSFKSQNDLEEHKSHCSFRTLTCTNEGCNSRFSVAQMDNHDSICPFKILPCEQNCSDSIMRREMDRHCITTCPMKLVKCPFYSVGCHSTIPQCTIDQHRTENLHSHSLHILRVLHNEGSERDLKERMEELEKLSSPGQLASARDARALTFVIKDLEAKAGPFKVNTDAKPNEEVVDLADTVESPSYPTKEVKFEDSSSKKEEHINSPSKPNDQEDSYQEKEKFVVSPTNVRAQLESQPNNKEFVTLNYGQENLKESPIQSNEGVYPPTTVEEHTGNSSIKEVAEIDKEEHATSPIKKEEHSESTKIKEHAKLPIKKDEHSESTEIDKKEHATLPIKKEEHSESTEIDKKEHATLQIKKEEHSESNEIDKKEHATLPIKKEEHSESIGDGEKHDESAA